MLTEFLPILRNHMDRYTGFRAREAYKLMYQCCMGPGHAVPDREIASKYFREEFDRVEPSDEIPLVETLCVDMKILRVNFAPFKTRGLNPEILFSVFTLSAERIQPNPEAFVKAWKQLLKMSEENKIDLRFDEMLALDEIASKEDYPPVHHSDIYRRVNSPAYRVVLYDALNELMPEIVSEIFPLGK